MSSFRERDFEARYSHMGDEAEKHFERYATEVLKKGYVRYGLNRPPLHMPSLPTRLRYTPDYLMSKRFVEVQGFGRDQTFKIKHEKLNSLHWWNDLHPLHIYVWDSHKERECMVHLFTIDNLIADGAASLETFREGKAYFGIKAEDLFAHAET